MRHEDAPAFAQDEGLERHLQSLRQVAVCAQVDRQRAGTMTTPDASCTRRFVRGDSISSLTRAVPRATMRADPDVRQTTANIEDREKITLGAARHLGLVTRGSADTLFELQGARELAHARKVASPFK